MSELKTAMKEFTCVLENFQNDLKPIKLSDFEDKSTVAFVCVDMINAFCDHGPLASKECGSLSAKVAKFLGKASQMGFENFLFIHDNHNENSVEFEVFPPHAIAKTSQSEQVKQIAELALKNPRFFYKNSFSIAYNDEFNEFLAANPHIKTFIVIGNCTDICVFSTIVHLRCSANEKNLRREIIVPKNLVTTFSLPGHDSRVLDPIFLLSARDSFGAKIVSKIK